MNQTFEVRLSDAWKQYIDHVPEGFEALGIVARRSMEEGALLHHEKTKRFYMMNSLYMKSLPTAEINEAIEKLFNDTNMDRYEKEKK